jgi:Alpha amylase, catalytic domain
MGPTRYPCLYQINTRVWLRELSGRLGRPARLADVPDSALDQFAGSFDWVWFLGVWQTGPAGRQVSRTNPVWQREFRDLMPDLTEEDVTGSPFAIQAYRLHEDFGPPEALCRLRQRLQQRGLHLMLDFVPNHTAPDHPWVREHPEFYIHGQPADLEREPQNYCRLTVDGRTLILAHGRDPYFPGWPDTLQLNYRHAGCRAAVKEELARVAGCCDGVRCDMAMLLLPTVFTRTWGNASLPRDGTAPVDTPFWPEAIAHVRAQHPGFVFMAEVYWDLEWTLQQQGFDYTYDKRLYDRLHVRDAEGVRAHLLADHEFQRKSVRFLENHDEPRAAGAFPPAAHRAAAVVTYFVPGLRFFHEGQLEGRRNKVSMHLGRRPDEPVDPALRDFYQGLLECLKRPEVREGRWRLLDCRAAWEDNRTWKQFIAFVWEGPADQRLLITVNYGPTQGQCYVSLPLNHLRGRKVELRDLMGPARYERGGDELAARGLYLDLPEWGYHVFEMK